MIGWAVMSSPGSGSSASQRWWPTRPDRRLTADIPSAVAFRQRLESPHERQDHLRQPRSALPCRCHLRRAASPAGHVEMDGSGTVRRRQWARAAPRRSPVQDEDEARGPVSMSSTVKEFEENRRIAWAHVGGHRCGTNSKRSTAVPSPSRSTGRHRVFPRFIEMVGYPERTRPICRRPSNDSKRSLPGVSLTDARSVETGAGRAFGRKRLERAEVDGRTRELPGPGGGDDSRRQRGRGATTIDREPIDLSCQVPHRRQRRRTAP